MTLIIVHKGDGTVVGRCDARCYNAKHPGCDCVCGGRNHGVGFRQAVLNNRAEAEQILSSHAGHVARINDVPLVEQLNLLAGVDG